VNHIIAFALTLTLLSSAALPARADEQADAFAACVEELASHEGISRSVLKRFHIRKSGSGYEVTGQDEDNHPVSCKTNGTRVTAVQAG
jgi:hypothetical protein